MERESSPTAPHSGAVEKCLRQLDKILELKRGGNTIHLDYHRMRFYGPEISYLRTATLNLDSLEVSFPDGNGQVWVRPIQTFISIEHNSHKHNGGVVQVDMRLGSQPRTVFTDLRERVKNHTSTARPGNGADRRSSGTNAPPRCSSPIDSIQALSFSEKEGALELAAAQLDAADGVGVGVGGDDGGEVTRLKEQQWQFVKPEEASIFTKLINIMDQRGLELFQVFSTLDQGSKGYVDVSDAEKAVSKVKGEDTKALFTPVTLAMMFTEGPGAHRLRFSDFFALMAFTPPNDTPTLEKYLLQWREISQQRLDDKLNKLASEESIHAVSSRTSNAVGTSEQKGRFSTAFMAAEEDADVEAEAAVVAPAVHAGHKPSISDETAQAAAASTNIAIAVALKELELEGVEEEDSSEESDSVGDDFVEAQTSGEESPASASTASASPRARTLNNSNRLSTREIMSLVTSMSDARRSEEVMQILNGTDTFNDSRPVSHRFAELVLTSPINSQEMGFLNQEDGLKEEAITTKEEVALLKQGSLGKLKERRSKTDQSNAATTPGQSAKLTLLSNAVTLTEPIEDENMPRLLQGEILVNKCFNSNYFLCTEKPFQQQSDLAAEQLRQGSIYLTNFRISFVSSNREYEGEDGEPVLTNRMHIPLGCISRIEKLDKESENEIGSGFQLCMICKDHRSVYFNFAATKGPSFASFFADVMLSYAFTDKADLLYAFAAHRHPEENEDAELREMHKTNNGWNAFIPEEEFKRQGLLLDSYSEENGGTIEEQSMKLNMEDLDTKNKNKAPWRLVDNSMYDLTETYPSAFIVPSQLSAEEITEAAAYRSRKRLPAVTWGAPNGAVLARSSQPMSGITASRSLADKLLLNLLRTKGRLHNANDNSKFFIIDCRSRLAATANAAMGKGVESDKNFVRTAISFCGIGNIHTMRDSYASLGKVVSPGIPQPLGVLQNAGKVMGAIRKGLGWTGLGMFSSSTEKSAGTTETLDGATDPAEPSFSSQSSISIVDEVLERDEALGNHQLNMDYDKRIADCGWVNHVRVVLSSSIMVAEKLHKEQSSVLVHCSDGWDRTAQVCATSQLMLDPFYRTLKGFFVLVEKDWCGFGHKFHDRLGTGYNPSKGGKEGDEVSPVFIQWLEVVWQLIQQFPSSFEYNEILLLFVADSLYSCISGTFLGNSELERKMKLECEHSTYSLWTLVMTERPIFINKQYEAVLQPLWPDARRVRLWERFHCRYSATSHPKVFTNEHWVEYSYGAAEMDMNEYSEDWATNTRSSRGVSLASLASPHSPYSPRNNNDDKRNSSRSSQGSPQKVDSYGATVRESF